VPNRAAYFDLVLMEKHRLKDSTPATPALSLIYALDLQINRILAEGLEMALCPSRGDGATSAVLGR